MVHHSRGIGEGLLSTLVLIAALFGKRGKKELKKLAKNYGKVTSQLIPRLNTNKSRIKTGCTFRINLSSIFSSWNYSQLQKLRRTWAWAIKESYPTAAD